LAGGGSSPRLSARLNPARASWTILLYASGDNNLEQLIMGNLREIQTQIRKNNNSRINFIIQFDGKVNSRLAAFDKDGNLKFTRPGGTVRGRLSATPSSGINLESPAGESPDLGELDMGAPQTLKDFVAWGKSRYPADRYALVISSHGHGWKAVST